MKTTTISKLIENTNIPASLVRAVVHQFGGWEFGNGYCTDGGTVMHYTFLEQGPLVEGLDFSIVENHQEAA